MPSIVHLAGRDYGFAPRDPIARDWPLSYTQHEYYYARDRRIPTYVFYFSEAYPFPSVDADYRTKYPDAERLRPLQELHRTALRDGKYVYSTIQSEADLRERIRELRLDCPISVPAQAPRRYWSYDVLGLIVLVGAWFALGRPGLEYFGQPTAVTLDRSGRVALAVAALPLLLALADHLWAVFRHWRERLLPPEKKAANFFQLAPRSKRDRRGFPREAHRCFPEWFDNLPVSLGHLAAASGTGKSSLIEGWLLPGLAGLTNPPEILHLRGGSNPLTKIAKFLGGATSRHAASSALAGDDATEEVNTENANALLFQRLNSLRTQNRRLVVVLDQFEETLILHHDAPQRLATLADFLRPWAEQRDDAFTILLSYRNDDLHRLGPARMPQPNFQSNAFELGPFPQHEAEAFLRDAQLPLTEADLDRVLKEARDHEQGDPDVRPIVANLLGLVLVQLTVARRKWLRVGNLARGYVERSLRTVRTDEKTALLLRRLISSSGRAQAARVTDLAAACRLPRFEADSFLLRLQSHGIVRLIEDPTRPALRAWAVAHDFLARLLDRALDRYTATLYSRLRPHVHLGLLLLLLTPGVWWVRYESPRRAQAQRDAAELYVQRHGFEWKNEEGGTLQHGIEVVTPDQLPALRNAIVVLNPRRLELTNTSAEQDLSFLAELSALEELVLSADQVPLNLRGFDRVKRLKFLAVQGNGAENVEILQKCLSLEYLSLSLKPIPLALGNLWLPYQLKYVSLQGQMPAPDLQWFSGIGAVEHLTIGKCTGLASLNGIASLKGLKKLSVDVAVLVGAAVDCPMLETLEVNGSNVEDQHLILGSRSLRTLSVRSWDTRKSYSTNGKSVLRNLTIRFGDEIGDLTVFGELSALESLAIRSVHRLRGFKGIEALSRLKKLDLTLSTDAESLAYFPPPKLTDLSGLSRHPRLEDVKISGFQELTAIGPLGDSPYLRRLILTSVPINEIGDLSNLPALEEVQLLDCRHLKTLDGLEGASTIMNITLSSNEKLKDVRALEKMPNLKAVSVKTVRDEVYVQLRALKSKKPEIDIQSDRDLNAIVSSEK